MFRFYGKIFSILKASFHYSARTARTDFWIYFLLFHLLFFAALGADVTYYQRQEPTGFFITLQELFGGRPPFVYLFLLLFTPALIAITVRRLHDIGKSGWLGLLFLIPFMGMVPMIFLLTKPGQTGQNQWGANPLDSAGDAMPSATQTSADGGIVAAE